MKVKSDYYFYNYIDNYHKSDRNPNWMDSKLYIRGCQQGRQPGEEMKRKEREVQINTVNSINKKITNNNIIHRNKYKIY